MRSNEIKRLTGENKRFRTLVLTLEEIKDHLISLVNSCVCEHIKENEQQMNLLQTLISRYEECKRPLEEGLRSGGIDDEFEYDDIKPMLNRNTTTSGSVDENVVPAKEKPKAKKRVISKVEATKVTNIEKKRRGKKKSLKSESLNSSQKRGRVGRPRKEEWPIFEQEKLEKASFICTWEGCEKRYYHNSHLVSHLRMHSGERPFPCPWPGCGKRYLTNSILMSHTKSAHHKEKNVIISNSGVNEDGSIIDPALIPIPKLPYKCEYCEDIGYKRRDQLDTHLSTMHASDKPLRCDWPGCDFQTVHSQKLKMHKMRHTGEKPYKCQWPSCEWSFRQQHHLKTHMLKHTGEKPHGCDWPGCERKFQSRQALRIHVDRTHSHDS